MLNIKYSESEDHVKILFWLFQKIIFSIQQKKKTNSLAFGFFYSIRNKNKNKNK